jgi:hypothetical protein
MLILSAHLESQSAAKAIEPLSSSIKRMVVINVDIFIVLVIESLLVVSVKPLPSVYSILLLATTLFSLALLCRMLMISRTQSNLSLYNALRNFQKYIMRKKSAVSPMVMMAERNEEGSSLVKQQQLESPRPTTLLSTAVVPLL